MQRATNRLQSGRFRPFSDIRRPDRVATKLPLGRFSALMELTLVPFRTDADGNEVVTFAFRPVA